MRKIEHDTWSSFFLYFPTRHAKMSCVYTWHCTRSRTNLPALLCSVSFMQFLLLFLPVRRVTENICYVCVVLNFPSERWQLKKFLNQMYTINNILSLSRIPEWPHGTDVCFRKRCWPESDVVPLRHTQAFWGRCSMSSPDDTRRSDAVCDLRAHPVRTLRDLTPQTIRPHVRRVWGSVTVLKTFLFLRRILIVVIVVSCRV